ncbi:MAG: VanW family protein [Flavobacteriia bacterium]|nr:VanW family protein [Flavobacteriia bacterium]
MANQELIEQHNLKQSFVFRSKMWGLILKRSLANSISGSRKQYRGNVLNNAPVIAASHTELWNKNDNPQNWILTAGKIENLRIAVRYINGLEVPANSIFSFWKHLGNPNWGKRYVIGREIREGCIIPTKAGGLCQLSNALYDAALNAHFEIIERHKHTKVVAGSLAEQNRDATVKWNYIDLRFKSEFAFRIEARLTDTELIVQFKSLGKAVENSDNSFVSQPVAVINDCFSCGNTTCFKHPTGKEVEERSGTTAYLLDEAWPEFDAYIAEKAQPNDYFALSVHNSRLLKSARYRWKSGSNRSVKANNFAALKRSIQLRLAAKRKQNPFQAALKADDLLARKLVQSIPVDCTHIVVSQNLLPAAWQWGVFGGRTFDVFMTRLPMETLHRQLDEAHRLHPESTTLNDFRAPETLVNHERSALNQARKIITPHRAIAAVFTNKTILLEWQAPTTEMKKAHGTEILFPASALGRKGAYAMKQLARELNLSLTVLGNATERDGFWETIPIKPFRGLEHVGVIVYPTTIEHQPRLLLKALAMGIPIITTPASGLTESELVTIVPINDYEALKIAFLNSTKGEK